MKIVVQSHNKLLNDIHETHGVTAYTTKKEFLADIGHIWDTIKINPEITTVLFIRKSYR